ncbi:hypothetical protein HAX54_025622 [Datura stramonium]|uniref:Uncharacterized protein n=1 Tax=Datura stramonium TaxID=4076 RepID=A0ABS8UZV4_DATST|nr:hypothetical protein [Datura stramonium]
MLFGHIDALINAGVRGGINSSVDLSEKEWEVHFKDKFDRILVEFFNAWGIAYSSSKAALDSMTKLRGAILGQHCPADGVEAQSEQSRDGGADFSSVIINTLRIITGTSRRRSSGMSLNLHT